MPGARSGIRSRKIRSSLTCHQELPRVTLEDTPNVDQHLQHNIPGRTIDQTKGIHGLRNSSKRKSRLSFLWSSVSSPISGGETDWTPWRKKIWRLSKLAPALDDVNARLTVKDMVVALSWKRTRAEQRSSAVEVFIALCVCSLYVQVLQHRPPKKPLLVRSIFPCWA